MLISTDFPHCTATASSALTHHPVTNLQLFLDPFITWMATSSQQDAWVLYDFGTAVPLDGVFLNFGNALSVVLQSSSNGSTFADWAGFSWPVDRRVDRRKGYLRSGGFNHRYLRTLFPISGLIATGQPYVETTFGELEFQSGELGGGTFEVGVIAPVRSVTVLDVFAPQRPLDYVPRGGDQVIEMKHGGCEVHNTGPRFLEATFNFRGPRTEDVIGGGASGPIGTHGIGEAPLGGGDFETSMGGLPQLRALQDITIGQAVLVSEELGDAAHAYLMRRIDADDEAEDFSVVTKGGWALREAI